MKRTVLVMMFCALLAVTPALFAQNTENYNHGEVGAFFDFTRLAHTSTNFYGVGGRVGFNISPHIQLEGEGAYDWNRNVSSSLFNVGTGSGIGTSGLRLVHVLFGPKIDFTNGPFRPFVTFKGGLLNFSTSTTTSGTFSSIAHGDTNGVFYPGAGVEGFIGWFGIRVEAGDEMYFDRGANHSFRFMGGPEFRF
jgi:hypothetical protein